MPPILPVSLSLVDSDNTTFPTTSGGSSNIAEDCPPSGINNALRSVAAMLAAMYGGFYSGTSRPDNVQSGACWLDTSGGVTAYVLKYYDGTDDIALLTINTTANTVSYTGALTGNVTGNLTGNVTGNLTGDVATLTTRGDLLYQGASADARLAIGTSGQYLTSDGTDPQWSTLTLTTLGTQQATTSGTTIDFTSIPSTTKWITIMLDGVSHDGTSDLLIQLGDSGGIEATGYTGVAHEAASGATAFSTGFQVTQVLTAAGLVYGQVNLRLMDASTNKWSASGVTANDDATDRSTVFSGTKSLSATLDRIRLTSVSGDTFDAGAINIAYGA